MHKLVNYFTGSEMDGQPIGDHNLPKTYLNKRNLRRCATRKRDNIVLIDIDSDDFSEVIILDVPESFKKKFRKEPKNVISVDDDDGGGEKSGGNRPTNNDASASNRCFPSEAVHPSTNASAADDSLFDNEGITPLKLSKSKRTYSGKNISRNCYGLDPNSENYGSDNDCSDCELMGDSSGELHEQWEKATYRKINDYSGVRPDFDDESEPSAPSHKFHSNSVEGTAEVPQSFNEKNNLKKSSMHPDGDGFAESLQGFSEGSEDSEQVEDPIETGEEFTCTPNQPLSNSAKEGKTLDTEFLGQHDARNHSLHPEGEDAFTDSLQKSYGGNNASDQDYEFVEMNWQFTSEPEDHTDSGCDGKERSGTYCSAHMIGDQCTVDTAHTAGNFGEKHAEQVKLPHHNFDAKITNEVVDGDNLAKVTKDPSKGGENEQAALFNSQQSSAILSLNTDNKSSCGYRNEAVSSSDQHSLITDRQKIKETEEYKHAMEEELAARQQQLLQQAEEARRLRNRKKAENMRIMMNEKRQKERLEEIRQTRIRDEENLNIKEKLRSEIRKELHRIEAICYDMASLLRYLGIHVSGGPCPSSNEVQLAYKRACLKFHPDRMSASDLRQQVEAEEKFKLISNMKDKLMLNR